MSRRHAIIVPAAVEVQCPYCGDPQPDPAGGSFMWEPMQVRLAADTGSGERTCVACDKPFRIDARGLPW